MHKTSLAISTSAQYIVNIDANGELHWNVTKLDVSNKNVTNVCNCPEPKNLDGLMNMQYASKMEQLDEILTWHGDVK